MTVAEQTYGIFLLREALIGIPLSALQEVCTVGALSPMLVTAPGLKGALDLRGNIVPLVDVAVAAGLSGSDAPPALAAIVRDGQRIAGIAIEGIHGISSVPADRLQPVGASGSTDLFQRGFFDNSAVVSILEANAFFTEMRLPNTIVAAKREPVEANRDHLTLLTFSAGGAEFGIEATRIISTIPRQRLDSTDLAAGPFLGNVVQHGWKLPVVGACQVLGLGTPKAAPDAEVVVLRCSDDARIGFAVDTINRISNVRRSDVTAAARVVGALGVLPDVIIADGGRQTHVVDVEALLRQPEFSALAELSFPLEDGAVERGRAGAPQTTDASSQAGELAERYVVVEAGDTYGIPAKDVCSIIDAPENLITQTNADPRVLGLFVHDGRSIPLSSAGTRRCSGRFALIVGEGAGQVGFLVDDVKGLMSLSWTADDAQEDHIALTSGQSRLICRQLDLLVLAAELSGGGMTADDTPRLASA